MAQQQKQQNKSLVIVIAAIAAFGGLLFGYDTGVISGALIQLKSDFEMTTRLQEWVTSIVLLGASAGAIFSGRITDRLGRKKVIIITAVIFGCGSIGLAVAPSVFWLIFWRLFIGIAIGIASYTVPLYISEISPTNVRGALVSVNQLAITVGILLSYLVDLGFAQVDEGWRWMFFIGFIPALILGIGMIFLTDTPRWLYSNGQVAKAKKVLQQVGEPEVDATIQRIEDSLKQEKGSAWSELTAKWVRPAMIIGLGIMFFQQFVGINTVIYYSPTIFEMAGFGAGEASSVAAVIKPAIPIGIINVLFTIVAMFLVDKWGRKPLLYLGLTGMVVSLIVLGGSFVFYQSLGGDSLQYLSLGSMIIYIPFFAVSLGPIAWLLISEVFPTKIRGVGMSIATLVNWFSNFLVTNTFLTLGRITSGEMPHPVESGEQLVNPGGAFLIYAFIGIIGIIFVNRFIPETKNHSLEEIEQHFQKGGSPRELK